MAVGDFPTTEASRRAEKARGRYHHGDLHRALLDAGLRLARAGGPEAVVLREATRQAGVSANAAYRHFADRSALLAEVVTAAQSQAALAMEAQLAGVPADLDRARRARATLRAVGAGYLSFARSEPGLFRTAFSAPAELGRIGDPASAGATGRTPFQLLSEALDECVTVGLMTPERRPSAEFAAWSAVHGVAMLSIAGPLRAMSAGAIEAIGDDVLEMVDRGLLGP